MEIIKSFKDKLKEYSYLNENISINDSNPDVIKIGGVTKDKKDKMREFGVDLKLKLESILVLEHIKKCNDIIIDNISKDLKETKVKSLKDLDGLLKVCERYIITNLNMGSAIVDLPGFVKDDPNKQTQANMYKLGSFNDKEVYVNPFFKYEDNKVLSFDKPFVNFELVENKEDVEDDIYAPVGRIGRVDLSGVTIKSYDVEASDVIL